MVLMFANESYLWKLLTSTWDSRNNKTDVNRENPSTSGKDKVIKGLLKGVSSRESAEEKNRARPGLPQGSGTGSEFCSAGHAVSA